MPRPVLLCAPWISSEPLTAPVRASAEMRGQPRDGVGRELLPRIGENDQFPGDVLHGGIQTCGFPPALREGQHAHACIAEFIDFPDRFIRRPVGDYEDAQPVGRILRREQILHASGDAILLIVRDDYGADLWRIGGRGARFGGGRPVGWPRRCMSAR